MNEEFDVAGGLARRLASPVAVHLTPPGRGAVATLLVEGPGAAEAVAAVFRSRGAEPLGALPPDRLAFGHVGGGAGRQRGLAPFAAQRPEGCSAQTVPVPFVALAPFAAQRPEGCSAQTVPVPFVAAAGEEVVLRRRSPQSIELHCHGGLAAVAMLQRLLAEQGCRPMTWQDWSAQTLEDPIQSAALAALAEARTLRTAAILLDQYHGALERAMESIRQSLAAGDIQRIRDETQRLLARADLGRHLTRPWQVVLTGPPNTGKSSLLNAMLGYCRAIVDPAAGTTRDVVTAATALDGWPVEFSDTAGIRATDAAVEQAGIRLAQQRVAGADLVVLVLDASQYLPHSEPGRVSPESSGFRVQHSEPDRVGPVGPRFRDRSVVDDHHGAISRFRFSIPDSRLLVVYNKSDLLSHRDPSAWPGLLTSVIHSEGIRELAHAISRRLVPEPPSPGEAVPFTVAQIESLREACGSFEGR